MSRRLQYIRIAVPVALSLGLVMQVSSAWADAGPLKALIVNGQMNGSHDWQASSPVLRQILEQTGLFKVDFATSPAKGSGRIEDFKPNFAAYDVVVLDYDGEYWSERTKTAFVEYVRSGGGVVSFHSANNAFPEWKEFNEIIGLGGWGGRNEKSGPYIRWRDGKIVRDMSPGRGGSHPPQHDYQVIIREMEHPITKGLPEKWMHAKDELYSELRGPAKNLTVLATAYADPKKGGTGEHEPVLFTVEYGKGRVFHTVFGHAKLPPLPCMECVGFIVTFQRGAEWAATGNVTQEVPEDFPTATEVHKWKNYTKPIVRKGPDMAELQELLGKVKTYDWGQSRLALTEVSEIIKKAQGDKDQLAQIEKALLGVLESDATRAGKQYVCRELSIIGTEQSVPTLAKMLTGEETSDMARYALERIPGLAVDEALRRSLRNARGNARIGIINSLGQRRDKGAVRNLRRILGRPNQEAAMAAAAALGQIADSQAAEALAEAKNKAEGKLLLVVLDAYLKCADKLVADGDKIKAMGIYKELQKEGMPKPIRTAALTGMINATKK